MDMQNKIQVQSFGSVNRATIRAADAADEVNDGNKAQVVVTRKWNLIGWARAARFVMDDVEIAKLGPGETVRLEVSAGRHVVSVRSGSASGPQSIVEFAPGETVRLTSNLARLSSDDGRPLSTNPGTAVPPTQGFTVLSSGFMSLWSGLAGDFRSPEDSDLVALMHTSAGWMFGLCAVCLGIIQLRNMYGGKISRVWEWPVWIGTIVGLIGLLLHFAGLIGVRHTP